SPSTRRYSMRLRVFSHARRRLIPLLIGVAIASLAISGVVGVSLGARPASAAGSTAFIRINQLGYAATATKRAYLMASAAETGATFSVQDSSGTRVASGSVGTSLGGWRPSYPAVYALDFDGGTTAGTSTIGGTGPIAAPSPSFQVATAANL